MKKSYLIGLLCAVALAGLFTITKVPAQGNPRQASDPEVVILHSTEIHPGPDGAYNGIGIYVSSSSSNAPKFPDYQGPGSQLYPAAQAIADCIKLGYEIKHVNGDYNRYIIMVKPAR